MPTLRNLQLALSLHRSGRLVEAEAAYRRVLEAEPERSEALHHLGLLRHQRGDNADARSLLRRAVAADPRSADARLHLGLVLEHSGEFESALAAYREAARLEPEAADAHFNQGLVLLRLERPREAETCFGRALELAPEDAEAAFNLGRARAGQARWPPAADAFDRALRLRPDWVAALSAKGGALRRMGRHQEALGACRRALALAPDDAGLHNNLGNVLRELGRAREAERSFRRALARDDRLPEAHLNLSRLRREAGDLPGARSACRRALALAPDLAGARPALASTLRTYRPSQYDPALAGELLRLMRAPDVDAQDLALAAAAVVRARHRLSLRGDRETRDASPPLAALARDELLAVLLTRTVNVDADLEVTLVALRRQLLFDAPPEHGDESDEGCGVEGLSAALALQCFANEYLFETSDREEARIESLAGALAAHSGSLDIGPRRRRDLLRLAMYRPLWREEAARPLAGLDASVLGSHLARVIERTLVAPLRERCIEPRITSAGSVRDTVSRRVRAQYENAPYPRWLSISAEDRVPLGESLARRFAHFRAAHPLGAGTRALVLGCGSGYEPIELALREPRFEIVAVDLSRASLAYAIRMADELGAGNVRFLHGDLLELGDVDGSFELVSASGVLHHMRDPLQGWRAAASRLREGGLMRVGLYSAPARRSIAKAREIIRRRGIPATPHGMRALRLALLRGDLGPELTELARSPDLHSLSGLRDLLFHVEEHHFDLEGIAAALSGLGLRFVGFEHDDPATVAAYTRMFPDDPSRTSLAKWARFEAAHPETFVGMYQFWCEKAPASQAAPLTGPKPSPT